MIKSLFTFFSLIIAISFVYGQTDSLFKIEMGPMHTNTMSFTLDEVFSEYSKYHFKDTTYLFLIEDNVIEDSVGVRYPNFYKENEFSGYAIANSCSTSKTSEQSCFCLVGEFFTLDRLFPSPESHIYNEFARQNGRKFLLASTNKKLVEKLTRKNNNSSFQSYPPGKYDITERLSKCCGWTCEYEKLVNKALEDYGFMPEGNSHNNRYKFMTSLSQFQKDKGVPRGNFNFETYKALGLFNDFKVPAVNNYNYVYQINDESENFKSSFYLNSYLGNRKSNNDIELTDTAYFFTTYKKNESNVLASVFGFYKSGYRIGLHLNCKYNRDNYTKSKFQYQVYESVDTALFDPFRNTGRFLVYTYDKSIATKLVGDNYDVLAPGFVEFIATTECLSKIGYRVQNLQKALIERGYDCGPRGADNVMSIHTREALIKFQQDNDLPIGNVNYLTWKALGLID